MISIRPALPIDKIGAGRWGRERRLADLSSSAPPRTGSSHLTALIGKHRDILFNSAIFHEKKVWVHWPKPDLTAETLAELAALRASDPDAFLERIFETNYGRSVVGFKMFSHHDKQAMAKILANPSI